MEFKRKATEIDISNYQIKVAEKIEWWWVKVDEGDLKNNIHIYWNKQTNGKSRGWQILSEETCLGKYSMILTDANFHCDDPTLQQNLNKIKNMAENLDYKKLIESPWRYATYQKNGPYMIIDGVHRQIATFINHFINGSKDNFLPLEYALCGICLSEVNTIIPENFCSDDNS